MFVPFVFLFPLFSLFVFMSFFPFAVPCIFLLLFPLPFPLLLPLQRLDQGYCDTLDYMITGSAIPKSAQSMVL